MSDRPPSRFRCGCAPNWHPKDGSFRACQGDVTHVYGADNPMVKWLREKHPESLFERAQTVAEEEFEWEQ